VGLGIDQFSKIVYPQLLLFHPQMTQILADGKAKMLSAAICVHLRTVVALSHPQMTQIYADGKVKMLSAAICGICGQLLLFLIRR
jgi:hypothetical protein